MTLGHADIRATGSWVTPTIRGTAATIPFRLGGEDTLDYSDSVCDSSQNYTERRQRATSEEDRRHNPQRKVYHRHLPIIIEIASSILLSWQLRQWSVWILFPQSFSGHGLRSLHSRQTW